MILQDKMKDSRLYELSQYANVAQFVSFGSLDDHGQVRFHAIRGVDMVRDVHEGLTKLLIAAPEHSVNLRTFRPNMEQGNPFLTGVTHVDEAVSLIRTFQEAGYCVIANESIDTNSGGVSGVRSNGLVEFSPRDTPRCVEKPGVATLSSNIANALFSIVYGEIVPLTHLEAGHRLEFSLHTTPVGLRGKSSVCWEISEHSTAAALALPRPDWPNRFSEFIGDKAYGLLLAHLHGFRVPRTLVLPRELPPFSFGEETGFKQVWTRTAPRRFAAGVYPTVHGYTDPFRLLAVSDPAGTEIGSVLIQDGADALSSGAVSRINGRDPSVFGVMGFGDDFMIGLAEADKLPREIETQALSLYGELAHFFGPVRFEWVLDRDQRFWIVQVNRDQGRGFNLLSGAASNWVPFDPAEGVEGLSRLISKIRGSDTGVTLARAVGLTSHIGDLLRAAAIPVRIPGSAEQPELW